ncbi:Rho termination factor N-terminal domain-containing protein [Ilumatobacter sp.]|uniref:Rho termination factor N-terminal domain-containing protein n=1 Tax=Ilumatobacter sp. TaxID=1967498 RepID=UPI003B52485F
MATATKSKKSTTRTAVGEELADDLDARTIAERIEFRLDEIQNGLPTIPAKLMELNRAVAHRTAANNRRNFDLLVESVQTVAKTTDSSVRTVVGTIRWTTEKTVDAASSGLRQIAGQARAQAKIAADSVEDQVTDLADETVDRVEAELDGIRAAEVKSEKRVLRSMTKDELYERAQDLEIEGRADMSKAQLVNAISSAT